MNVIKLFIKREIIIFKHNWLGNIILWFLFPIIMFTFLTIPLYKIIPHQTLDYLHWAMPGIWIVTSSIVCAKVGMSRMSQLYASSSPHQSILKAPIPLWQTMIMYFIVPVIFGIIQLLFSILILGLINQGSYSFYQYLILILQISSMIVFISGFSGFFGFIMLNEQATAIILLLLFSILSFGFGGLIPINLYPKELSSILLKIPMTNIIQNTQNILLLKPIYYWGAVTTFIIGILLLLINIIIGHKLLRS